MFREAVVAQFGKLGARPVGLWEAEDRGEFDRNCVIGVESAEARECICAEFAADPDWRAGTARWADGPPGEMTKSTVMVAIGYAPER